MDRVTYSEPRGASRIRSNAGTSPLADPYNTNVPRGFRQARDCSKVALPTESYTAARPRLSVRRFTSTAKSDSVYRIISSAPASREDAAFILEDTVVSTRAPQAFAI